MYLCLNTQLTVLSFIFMSISKLTHRLLIPLQTATAATATVPTPVTVISQHKSQSLCHDHSLVVITLHGCMLCLPTVVHFACSL